MTSLITNATFTEGTVSKTVQGSGGKVNVPSGWDFQYSFSGWNDAFVEDGVFNAWAGTISRAELSQKLSLPNGAYRLSAEVKTDMDADASTIALYGAGTNGLIGRSLEVGKGDGDFSQYSCAFDVTDGTVTIGIRSDKAYYQVKNFTLTYLGETAGEETAASYLRQDYYWNGRNSLEFDATLAKYAEAKNVVVYPKAKNQLVRAASTAQFAATDNKIVDGVCQRLVLTDKEPFNSSTPFTAVKAVFERTFTKGTLSTVCLPFTPIDANGQFYRLDREDTDNNVLVFVEEESPEANTPYIYQAAEDGKIEGNNVSVVATPATMRSNATASGFYMEGCYTTKSVSNIYGFNTSGELLKASTATMTPFRAFIQSPGDVQTAKAWTSMFENEATGIAHTQANGNARCDVYSVDGILLRQGADASAALEGLKSGLYIIKNGSETRKTFKR